MEIPKISNKKQRIKIDSGKHAGSNVSKRKNENRQG